MPLYKEDYVLTKFGQYPSTVIGLASPKEVAKELLGPPLGFLLCLRP